MTYVDRDGKFWWLIPMIIGGITGNIIANEKGVKGWDKFSYILGGAAIGVASAGAAIGVSTAAGSGWFSAFLSGAAGGAVGGAGFNGLATGWNGDAMLNGFWKGGLSGGIGSVVSNAVGGAGGAAVGGAVSAGINIALDPHSNIGDIGESALLGGTISFASYHASSLINYYFDGGNKWGDIEVTYGQYLTMQADFQRAYFYEREYGGWLLNDGTVEHGKSLKNNVVMPKRPENAIGEFHTHWREPGSLYDFVDKKTGKTYETQKEIQLLYGPNEKVEILATRAARYHGQMDYHPNSIVMNKYDASYLSVPTTNYSIINPSIIRYFPIPILWR